MPMSRRKDRILYRSPSPGIPLIPESTSPPPPPRIQRTRPIELPSRSIVTNLNERLALTLSSNSSTTPSSCSPIGQTQQQSPSRSSSSPSSQCHASSSPSSSKSSKSSSPPSATNSPTSPRRHYESWLYHLYDTTEYNRITTTAATETTTNQSLSGWDALRASSDTSDTSSQNSYQHLSITPVSSPHQTSSQPSPRQISSPSSPSLTQQHPSKSIANTPNTSPHRRTSQSSQQYTSNTTSPSSSNTPISSPHRPSSSNTPISSPHRPSSSPSSSQPPRKIRACQTKHIVGSDRKYPKRRTQVSPHRRRPPNSMIGPKKYSSSTAVESDTSEEEMQLMESGSRPAWMSRLRPRHNNSSNSNLVGNNKKSGANGTGKSNVRKPSATPNNNNRMETNTNASVVKKQLQPTKKMKSKSGK